MYFQTFSCRYCYRYYRYRYSCSTTDTDTLFLAPIQPIPVPGIGIGASLLDSWMDDWFLERNQVHCSPGTHVLALAWGYASFYVDSWNSDTWLYRFAVETGELHYKWILSTFWHFLTFLCLALSCSFIYLRNVFERHFKSVWWKQIQFNKRKVLKYR